MPTFRKYKGLKGNFTSEDITAAAIAVFHHKIGLREAARRYNLSHATLGRYIKKAKQSLPQNTEQLVLTTLSMNARQVSVKCFCGEPAVSVLASIVVHNHIFVGTVKTTGLP